MPRASVVFVTATQVAADPTGNELKGAFYACYDAGQAAAHLTLQARAMGLHAHQFGGFDRDAVAVGLGVPDYFRVLSGIAVGVRGDRRRSPRRTAPVSSESGGDGRWRSSRTADGLGAAVAQGADPPAGRPGKTAAVLLSLSGPW